MAYTCKKGVKYKLTSLKHNEISPTHIAKNFENSAIQSVAKNVDPLGFSHPWGDYNLGKVLCKIVW